MFRKGFLRASSLSALTIAMLPVQQAYAQDDTAKDREPSGLAEIIVTAQKREQALQDVPVSVQVVTGDVLQTRSETEISSLEKFDPSVRFAEGTQDAERSINIRGVGTQSFSRGLEQSAATVVDGVNAVDPTAALLDFNDVQRIEVLRGPQGILFGKNASSGLLNIVTKNPTKFFEAGGGVTYGSENLLLLNGYVSGPVGEDVAVRVAAFRNKRDAFLKNAVPGGPDMNNRDDWGVRTKVQATTGDLDVLLTYSHSERNQLCCASVGNERSPGAAAENNGGPFGDKNDLVFTSDPAIGKNNLDTVALELNYSLGNGGTITSVTGWQNSKSVDDFRAINGGPIHMVLTNIGNSNFKQFTQELRYASQTGGFVEYLVGAYYYRRTLDRTLDQKIDISFLLGAGPQNTGLSQFKTFDLSNSSVAGFANVTFNIADAFRISTGGRLQHDRASINDEQVLDADGTFVNTVPIDLLGTRSARRGDTAVSWRVALEYDLTQDVMLYASATRGYKGLGINSLGGVIDAVKPIIDPEIPTAFELGWKSELLDHRLRFNGAIFYNTFKNFQAEATTDQNGDGVSEFSLTSAGKLTTKGVELTLDAKPVDALTLTAAVSYIDAKYNSFVGAPCYFGQTEALGCVGGIQDLSGSKLPNVSKWSYTVTGRYDVPIDPAGLNLYAMGTWLWRGDHNPTSNPADLIESYGTADFFVGIESQDHRFGLQAFVKNAFDKFYRTGRDSSANGLNGYSLSSYLPYDYKRRWGVSANFHF